MAGGRETVPLPLESETWHALPSSKADTASFMFNRTDREAKDAFGNPVMLNKGTAEVHECDPVCYIVNDLRSCLVDLTRMNHTIDELFATYQSRPSDAIAEAEIQQALARESPDFVRTRVCVFLGAAGHPLYINDVTSQNLAVMRDFEVRIRNTSQTIVRPFDFVAYRLPVPGDAKMDYTPSDSDPVVKQTMIAVPNGLPRAKSIAGEDAESIQDRDPRISSWHQVGRCLAGCDVAPGRVFDMLIV
jgi:hypothetical protein